MASAFVKALDELGRRYRIHNIRISPYNSQANGLIERAHRPLRDALVKAADGDESRWPTVLHSVLWAERVTIQRATKHSPYWLAHGVEPSFPFDLAEATYLVPPLDAPMSTEDLLAIRARQLQKRAEDLEEIKERVLKARWESVRQFVKLHQHRIRDYDFKPGSLVLVRNSAVEKDLDRKTKPRFFGPIVVVGRTPRGAYELAELDRSVSGGRYAAFRVVPYYSRTMASVDIEKILHYPERRTAKKHEKASEANEGDETDGENEEDEESEEETEGEAHRRTRRRINQ